MSQLFTKEDKRTHYCGELSNKNIGQRVTVCGWVQKQRDLGSLIFIDLRDREGIIQLSFDEATPKEVFDLAFTVRSEYVLSAKGVVRARSSVNKNIKTGDIEIAVDELKIISEAETTPFEITDNTTAKEELRLKYRYLDLRRPTLQKNIIMRHKIAQIAREYFYNNGFIEIETPMMIKPTPEGARDYLVPSRIHHGKTYALPQSPQIYKQLLMLSGFDRYIQLARCFRDEDLRADRQPEFTQIDLEMSFVEQEDIMEVVEGFFSTLFSRVLGVDVKLPIRRMTFRDAMNDYGSDKPDLRFGMKIQNISDAVAGIAFPPFADALANGGSVRAIVAEDGAATLSRSDWRVS
ncbi:MAG: aspartate--tRNA ligase, partial [Clostridia bacterium]|nr:aspartate--tRNA ligase [Clostridia bacterium]